MAKCLSLCLVVVLVVSSLLMVIPANAQSIPKPSVPEFTIKFVNESYTETTTNPYTGIKESTLISNNSIVITITNQPFDYSNYQLYYNIRSKPYFEGNWTEVYPVVTGASSYEGGYNYSYAQYINHYSVQQSKSSFTTISFSVKPTDLYQATGYDVINYYGIPYGSQLDFQVEAQVGHPSQIWVSDHPLLPIESGGFEPAVAYDTSSGWSNTQTITIGESSSTTTPTLPPDTVSDDSTLILFSIIIATLVISIISLLLYVRHLKRSNYKN